MRKPEEVGLTKPEWAVILDVMNGHMLTTDALGNPMMAYRDEVMPNVEDGIALDGAAERHGAHGDTLLTKLAAFTDEDWQTVKAVVEGFWEAPDVRESQIPGRPAPRVGKT